MYSGRKEIAKLLFFLISYKIDWIVNPNTTGTYTSRLQTIGENRSIFVIDQYICPFNERGLHHKAYDYFLNSVLHIRFLKRAKDTQLYFF